jgi:hypothetical protein
MLATWSQPWLIVLLMALAVGMLEAERWWTRWLRRRGQRAHVAAYALDGLAVTSVLLALLALLALLVRGLLGAASLLGELIGLAAEALLDNPWALAALVAVLAILGLSIVMVRNKRRAPRREPAPRPARSLSKRAGFFDTLAAEELHPQAAPSQAAAVATPQHPAAPIIQDSVAPPVAPQIAPSPTSSLAASRASAPVEGLASLSMMEQRRVYKAAPVPQSFLPPTPAVEQRRGKFPVALLLLVVLAGGGFFFRQQLLELLPNIWPTTSAAISRTAEVVPRPTVGVASPAPAPTAPPLLTKQVASDELNLRAGPGTDQQVLATLRRGEQVILLGETQAIDGRTWARVRVGNLEGWVSQEFLE